MRIRAISFTIITAIALFSVCAFYALYQFPKTSLSTKNNVITFELVNGASVKSMLKQLTRQQLFTPFEAALFCLFVQFKDAERLLKAGEYAIPLNITPDALLKKLIKGDVIQYALTLPEGATIKDVLNIMSRHDKIKKTLSSTSNEALSMEGILFPDTYYYVANTTDVVLLRRAHQRMLLKLQNAWVNRDPTVVLKTPYEALILASIIEKETGRDDERFIISGVLQRRLTKKMRLQVDPSVVYGLQEEFQGFLTKDFLKKESPFNTYLHAGLPPTPIALPSMKAIIAALNPDQGEALYFVAKGDGSHYFSVTLQEHNQAVQKYRRGNNE